MTDLVDDLRSAVLDAAAIEGLAPECGKRMALAVCLSIQREWGASRPYVRSARAHRDGEIVRAVARGETLERGHGSRPAPVVSGPKCSRPHDRQSHSPQ